MDALMDGYQIDMDESCSFSLPNWSIIIAKVLLRASEIPLEKEREKREKVSERKDEKLANADAKEQLERREEEVKNQENDKYRLFEWLLITNLSISSNPK